MSLTSLMGLANKIPYKFATTMFTTFATIEKRIGEDKTCRCDYKGRNGDI